ncbi:MAG: AIPR family protein [Bacteriovoracaceae bacterium]|nr:AIPR family protein [Bacteriovoracaceae bacterium]
MHRIVKSHLDNFSKNFGLEKLSESYQFEVFCNYSLLYSRVSGDLDATDVTTSTGDDGIDGIAIIVDEELLISDEDAKNIFSTEKKNHEVEFVFIQAKRSESFDLGDFLKFKESILRFITSEKYDPLDDVQVNTRKVFDICISNVPKIRGGKPSLTARFVTTGNYQFPTALETALKDFKVQLEELGYFSNVDISFIGRDELTTLWVSTYSGIEAQLTIFSNAPLPPISGIEEAYLVVAKAKDVVFNLLQNKDGTLRTQVFEENVRSFLGIENPVNKSIANTIHTTNSSTRFPVLNNGITIVSPDVRVQGNTLHLLNFQIVNGCQTSNVLYENREYLSDDIMVNLKIVETLNEDVFSELVRATNSQSEVKENQFFSLRPIVKRIEQYFDSFDGLENRLYFERRQRQFVGRDIQDVRIFSVHNTAKCVGSMFLRRPDLAYRYPRQVFDKLGADVFSEDNKEIIYYTSCLALYRFQLFVSNAQISQNMKKYKWHILALFRAIVCDKNIPPLNSKQIEIDCTNLVNVLSANDASALAPFLEAVFIIDSMGAITDDRLKRQLVLDEMFAKIKN